MTVFPSYIIKEKLGVTPLVGIEDQDVWNYLLTPQIKALIGTVSQYGEPQVLETVKGQFPGDDGTNLNQHLLFGRSLEDVRFPYLSVVHRTEYGALVIKRDGIKLKAMCYVGDVFNGHGQLVYIAALRDRRYDGTKRANDSALLFYPYDDPKFHKPLTLDARCAEVSVYSFSPGSRIATSCGDRNLDEFVERPFAFLTDPEKFVRLFRQAWETDRAPGQVAAPIADVSKKCLPGFERLAQAHGYDFLECATSHYHVARWFKARQYRYTFTKDEQTMAELASGIDRIRAAFSKQGHRLRRPQESWIAVVQSLRPIELIPDGLFLDGPLWPQDNINPQNLWMNKPLTERALQLVPGPLPFEP